ncbi:MAG: glycosyltransferase family 2 protein [Candidatus Adiutrix sp.]|jgi:glycosyltransferase involved in cell wall biosynthesis|nr:glycosyltransferase family 2 protein [Candidatus Adiutrix sp.]
MTTGTRAGRARLTIAVLTKNESANIADCLKSVDGADEIVVVDDFSDDATMETACQFGAKIVQRRLDSFAEQRNFALSAAAGDWVFFLDADERFSPGLMEEVRRHIEANPGRAGSVRRKNFAFGRRHHFGPLKPDRASRLFPANSVRWEGLIHERPLFKGPARPLKGWLLHLTYRDFDHYLKKQHRYAAAWAAEAAGRGQTAGPMTAVIRAALAFAKMLCLNLGFLGGPLCWALCFFHAGYTLTKYLKLHEINEKT